MVAAGNSTIYPLANFCNDLVIGGFSDWYMPAKNELEICYYNLKPSTDTNNTSFGTNANSVPTRTSNYTNSVPAQTSATNFRVPSGAEKFGDNNSYPDKYWSSTQGSNSDRGSTKYFWSGFDDQYYKTRTDIFVRALRRVAV